MTMRGGPMFRRELCAWCLIVCLTVVLSIKSMGKTTLPPKLYWKDGGNCLCSTDEYCMCTPSLAVDVIIEVEGAVEDSVVLVRRVDNGKHATIGGFCEVGESVEATVSRELKEETGLDLLTGSVRLFGLYSDPRRDHRRHTVSAAYVAKASSLVGLRPGDDAKQAEVIPLQRLHSLDFAFDHQVIVADYLASKGHVGAATGHPSDW
eukprot:CAMPEP_0171638990 /NCGR_PEP_ID=MMETSP0990-20121206/29375_1 /TAXON_ID=483369 /ORGANISM="non described non described, Strain CCMP2098" /LENGTH=205 /DNA_ID=CAMNT_0012212499 /DNA_START=1 /DNA_END=615 /DNA_ORIENTATION=+